FSVHVCIYSSTVLLSFQIDIPRRLSPIVLCRWYSMYSLAATGVVVMSLSSRDHMYRMKNGEAILRRGILRGSYRWRSCSDTVLDNCEDLEAIFNVDHMLWIFQHIRIDLAVGRIKRALQQVSALAEKSDWRSFEGRSTHGVGSDVKLLAY